MNALAEYRAVQRSVADDAVARVHLESPFRAARVAYFDGVAHYRTRLDFVPQ